MRPYCWFAATLLFLSYGIGLWFTLRTHAAVIWNNEVEEKKAHGQLPGQAPATQQPPPSPGTSQSRAQRQFLGNNPDASTGSDIRESALYKKVLGQSLKEAGLPPYGEELPGQAMPFDLTDTERYGPATTPHMVPPKGSRTGTVRSDVHIPGFSEAENNNLVREIAELAATAATIAAQNATNAVRKGGLGSHLHGNTPQPQKPTTTMRTSAVPLRPDAEGAPIEVPSGGHDAPNWSRTKSSIILMGATILYALIAEILVNTVDVVLNGFAVDEKFIGITLFALVPNTTEFLVSQSLLCHTIRN